MTRYLARRGVLGACFAALLGLLLGLPARPGHAGELEFYESSAGIDQVRTISGPVTNAVIDIDYAPATAEGAKIYGLSELSIEATGDLDLTPSGFSCQATSCLFTPQPFVTGARIRVTAGNDLLGASTATANLLRIGVTGTTGHVVLTRGEYLDGTGPAGTVGSIQTPDITILVTVPESGLANGLAAACALVALAARGPLRTASTSARSGRVPGGRAPRAR